jgi:hypothetical protein
MNETMEEKLAQSLFERGAEKCFDKNTRVAFCKKYLIQQGIDINPPKPVTPNYSLKDYQYFGKEEIFAFHAKEAIDEFKIHQLGQSEASMFKASVTDSLIRKLTHDLYKNGFIHMDELKNYANDTTDIHVMIKAAKWDLK